MQNIALPALGQITDRDWGTVYEYIRKLAWESSQKRDKWVQQADQNDQIFNFGSSLTDDPTDPAVINNEIQQAVIAQVQEQVREKIRPMLEPADTGAPPQMFALDPRLSPGPVDPGWVQQMTAPTTVATDMGTLQGPPAIDPGQFIAVDVKTMADVHQTINDRFWERSRVDAWTEKDNLWRTVHGWRFSLYEYDHHAEKDKITGLSVKQVYVDPTVEEIEDAAYAIVDLYLDADVAIGNYPELAAVLKDRPSAAREGNPIVPEAGASVPAAYNLNFQRKMFTLRIAWLRDQVCPARPMTTEQALSSGMVQQAQIPVEPLTGPEQPDDAVLSPPMAVPTTRSALIHSQTSEEVTPDHPAWPQTEPYLCIRQITILNEAKVVVEDVECPYWDIPLLHNVNIPLFKQPWGIGEPMRLAAMQEADNSLLRAMVDYAQYFRYPRRWMPEGMFNALVKAYGTADINPNQTGVIPDTLWNQYQGKIDITEPPPPLPQALVEVHSQLNQAIDKSSSHTDVMRGTAPTANSSGRLVENLQSQNASMMGYKAQRTAHSIERLARFQLDARQKWLTLDMAKRIISKYPDHVLQYILDWGKNSEWDITVEVPVGTQGARERKEQRAITFYQSGLQSRETTQEELRIDPQQEQQRQAREAMAMAAMAPPAEESSPQPSGNGHGNNGNGKAAGRFQ